MRDRQGEGGRLQTSCEDPSRSKRSRLFGPSSEDSPFRREAVPRRFEANLRCGSPVKQMSASAVPLLQATLDEEKATDLALTEIAEDVVNQEAEAA